MDVRTPPVDPRAPIGVFDSGVGGLSVLREVRRLLPAEELVYVADSAYGPYGDRSAEYVLRRSEAITAFLAGLGAKAVLVACNTASGSAIESLRARHPFPIVAMEPAVKPAVAATRSGVIGVLATAHTVAGSRFARLVAAHAASVQVLRQPCVGLAERVEAGDLTGPDTRALVEKYVRPLVDAGADTLVIGCTHYAFLEDLVASVAGPDVRVVDPSAAVARQLRRRLTELGLLAPEGGDPPAPRFFTTGPPADVGRVMERLWGSEVDVRAVSPEGPASSA